MELDYNVITREKNGGIQVIVSYKDNNGKWKQKSKQGFENSKKGEKVAKNWANDIITELKKNPTVNRQYEDITFKEYFDMFLEDRENTLRESTLINYRTMGKKFKSLDNLKLNEITTMDIQREFNKMVEYNELTIRGYLKRLNCLFNFAVNKYEILAKSPVKNIEFTGNKSIEKTALNSIELDKLLNKLKDLRSNSYYIASLLAAKCGLRIGEILGLTWLDIDFKENIINVKRQWTINKKGSWDFGKLKSDNSYRSVPMPPVVVKELGELKRNYVINMDARILKIKNTKSYTGNLCTVYKRLGFDISIHELRHTYATNLISNGLDFKTAAKLLGHDIEQTMKTYSHVNTDMMEKAKNIINNNF